MLISLEISRAARAIYHAHVVADCPGRRVDALFTGLGGRVESGKRDPGGRRERIAEDPAGIKFKANQTLLDGSATLKVRDEPERPDQRPLVARETIRFADKCAERESTRVPGRRDCGRRRLPRRTPTPDSRRKYKTLFIYVGQRPADSAVYPSGGEKSRRAREIRKKSA